MPIFMTATVIVWGLTLWAFLGVLRGPGVIRRLKRVVAVAVWGSLGCLFGMLLVLLQSFHAFSNETLIASVMTRRLTPQAFELVYTPVHECSGTRVHLQGDQWSISGGIVKWHPWLTALGLASYHRELRIAGQFSDVEQQRRHLPTVHSLSDPAMDHVWEIFYRAGAHLSFIEAVYGSSAYVYVEPGTTQAVYVTPSGYLIKRTQTP